MRRIKREEKKIVRRVKVISTIHLDPYRYSRQYIAVENSLSAY